MPDPAPTPARETAPRRRGHVRLIAFFAALGLLGTAGGWLLLGEAPDAHAARAALAASAGGVAALGCLGVWLHRRTIAKARWRETQDYLDRIRRASERYRALMEGAADMLLVVEAGSRRVRECNALARERLGRHAALPSEGAAEAGAAIESLFAPADRERLCAAIALARPATGVPAALGDLRLALEGARPAVCSARLAAVDWGGERLVQVALRDLTHEKEMEQQLAIRERLSSIGLLTAGVAHEINNPLEGIGNYVGLLEREGLSPEQRRRYLEMVRHGFARIGEIVRDLLSFARPAPTQDRADLARVVERALQLARYSERLREVEIEMRGLEGPLLVVGDERRLEQLVLNLVWNAAQAMRGRGRIRLGARSLTAEDSGRAEVELAVEDEGPGIPPENLERIFDPFFTTGTGSGLGLSVSYGIARAHGGELRAENRAEGGARFVLRLSARGAEPMAEAS